MNVKTILSSFGIHLPDKEKKITFAMHSHKISTPTGTPVPDEKVKELSSIVSICPAAGISRKEEEHIPLRTIMIKNQTIMLIGIIIMGISGKKREREELYTYVIRDQNVFRGLFLRWNTAKGKATSPHGLVNLITIEG